MARIEITQRDLTAGQLRAASGKAPDARSARRMLAFALVLEGVDHETAANNCGMDRQTLRDWVHRYNAEGLEGLANRKSPGPRPLLSAERKAELAALVEKGPDPSERWRRALAARRFAAALSAEMFGVDMHERAVGEQLKELGYVRLSVRPRHPKSDEQAQEDFKKILAERCGDSPRKRLRQAARNLVSG